MHATRSHRTTTPAATPAGDPAGSRPGLAFLHVQGSKDDPIRVFELPAGPVRVGRGPQCEVRLGGPYLSDVQCLLRPKGDGWHIQPVGPPGQIWIDGRPDDAQRALVFGVPFRVGEDWLTLRSPENATNDWGTFSAPITIEPQAPEGEPTAAGQLPARREPSPPAPARTGPDDDRVRRWQARVEARERWLKDQQEERRWEARWKSAGESIRARSASSSPPPAAHRTPPTPAPTPAPQPAPGPRPVEARSVVPRPPEPFRRVLGPERRAPLASPTREPIRGPVRPRALAPPRPATPAPPPAPVVEPPAIEAPAPPPVEPARGLVFLPPAPAEEAAPTPGARPGPAAPIAPEPVAEVATLVEAEEVRKEAPPEVMVEAIPAPASPATEEIFPVIRGEFWVPPFPLPDAPEAGSDQEEADWFGPASFVAETFDSAPEMVWVAPMEWPEPEPAPASPTAPEPRARPAPAPAIPTRPAPEAPAIPAPAEAPETVFRDVAAGGPREGFAWPTARSIFAAQGMREPAAGPAPEPAPARRRGPAAPEPTDARAPARWTWPLWLGWLPAAALVAASGLAASALTVAWIGDATAGDNAARIALRPDDKAGPFIDPATIPRGPWWRTTAPHLSAWAVAVGRLGDGEDHSADVRELIEEAALASRLAARSRFVVSDPIAAGPPRADDLTYLGRPRDVVTLAEVGRKLRRLGKVDSSIRAYRSAFAMAAAAAWADLATPAFDDGSQARRYALPHESLLNVVARDMAAAGPWDPGQWAEALPPFAPAHLAAARALRPADPAGADRLLEAAAGLLDAPTLAGLDPAEHRAGVAEAMAIRGRWTDSAAAYRLAIDGADDDATRRMWSLNLADIALRMGDHPGRARALEAAKDVEAGDPVTRKAQELSQAPGGLAEPGRRP